MAQAAPNSFRSAELYWNAAADTYERKFSGTSVGRVRRQAVWRDLERAFQPRQRILELSCGTGIDALFLARRGIRMIACDVSPRMIELARNNAATEQIAHLPDFRILPTENLAALHGEPLFDGAFSNFAGLNCVADLAKVSEDLGRLLKPGAKLILNMMGRFVPVEILWFLAHGSPRKAFQRLSQSHTSYAAGELSIYRPTVSQIVRSMQPAFKLLNWKGIGIIVPPSYTEHVAARYPAMIQSLARIDARIGSLPVIRNMSDCVLLTFERRDAV